MSVGTPLAEIETEKALVEYAAEEAGIVGRLLLGEGDTGADRRPDRRPARPGRDRRGHRRGPGRLSAPRHAAPASSAATQAAAVPAAAAAAGIRRRAAAANGHQGGGAERAGLRQPAGAQARRGAGHRPGGAGRDRAERADRAAGPGAVPRGAEAPARPAPAGPSARARAGACGESRRAGRRSTLTFWMTLELRRRGAVRECPGQRDADPAYADAAGDRAAAYRVEGDACRTSTWWPTAWSMSCSRCARGSTRRAER